MNTSSLRRHHRRSVRVVLVISGLLVWGLLACAMTGDGSEGVGERGTEYLGPVEIQLGRWRSDLPPGLSLVVPGGGLVNNGFPTLSADRTRIAIFYHSGYPLIDGYPTLDIYSTASLTLQERIDFFPEHQQIAETQKQNPDLNDPALLARIERRVADVDRYLKRGGFHSIPKLFEFKNDSVR